MYVNHIRRLIPARHAANFSSFVLEDAEHSALMCVCAELLDGRSFNDPSSPNVNELGRNVLTVAAHESGANTFDLH